MALFHVFEGFFQYNNMITYMADFYYYVRDHIDGFCVCY